MRYANICLCIDYDAVQSLSVTYSVYNRHTKPADIKAVSWLDSSTSEYRIIAE